MGLDSKRIDEAAEDPPAKWVAAAVAGLVLAAVGLVALVLGLVGLDGAVRGAAPFLGVVFDMSVPLLILGVGLFLVSMTEWDPDVSG